MPYTRMQTQQSPERTIHAHSPPPGFRGRCRRNAVTEGVSSTTSHNQYHTRCQYSPRSSVGCHAGAVPGSCMSFSRARPITCTHHPHVKIRLCPPSTRRAKEAAVQQTPSPTCRRSAMAASHLSSPSSLRLCVIFATSAFSSPLHQHTKNARNRGRAHDPEPPQQSSGISSSYSESDRTP